MAEDGCEWCGAGELHLDPDRGFAEDDLFQNEVSVCALPFCAAAAADGYLVGDAEVGVPAGAEFALFSVYDMVVYAIIRPFGAEAQAGFGIGARVMQAMFLPVVELSFAVSPVVGQDFGGRRADRVRHAVFAAIGLASALMLVLAVAAWVTAPRLIRRFSQDPRVIAFGSEYLTIVAAAGIVFSSSSVFQGIGNTIPPLVSTASRLLLFALPAVLLSRTPGFQIRYVWYLSVAAQLVQACCNLLLLRRELGRKLRFSEVPGKHELSGANA